MSSLSYRSEPKTACLTPCLSHGRRLGQARPRFDTPRRVENFDADDPAVGVDECGDDDCLCARRHAYCPPHADAERAVIASRRRSDPGHRDAGNEGTARSLRYARGRRCSV